MAAESCFRPFQVISYDAFGEVSGATERGAPPAVCPAC